MKKIMILIILVSLILFGCYQQDREKIDYVFEEQKEIIEEEPEKIEIPEIVKQKCNDDCVETGGGMFYLVEYNPKTELFDCHCLNRAGEILVNLSYDYESGKEVELTGDEFYSVKELHWTHMPITYFIINEEECGSYEANKIKKGFDEIENATNGIVSFKKINMFADIDVHCSFIEDCYEYRVDIRREEGVVYRYETICTHKKGLAGIADIKGNKILKAEIEMIGLAGFAETTGIGSSGFYIGSCGHPTTEIHEILHTFGYEHIDNEDSIMYYQEDAIGYTVQEKGECIGKRKYIDNEIVEDLVKTYSKPIS